jgi:hypothetical protein
VLIFSQQTKGLQLHYFIVVAKLALPKKLFFVQNKALRLQLHFFADQGLQLHYFIVVAKLALLKNCFFAEQGSAATIFITPLVVRPFKVAFVTKLSFKPLV